MALPQFGAVIPDGRFIPFGLETVESRDQAKHELHGPGLFRHCLNEVAPGVRPAADPSHAGMRADVARISLIQVRLQNTLEAVDQRRQFAVAT
jgi:hypothetical protein